MKLWFSTTCCLNQVWNQGCNCIIWAPVDKLKENKQKEQSKRRQGGRKEERKEGSEGRRVKVRKLKNKNI